MTDARNVGLELVGYPLENDSDILPFLIDCGWSCINPYDADPSYMGVLDPFALGDVSHSTIRAHPDYMGEFPLVTFHRNHRPQLYTPEDPELRVHAAISYFITANVKEEPEELWNRKLKWQFFTKGMAIHLGNTYSFDRKMLASRRDAVWDLLVQEAYHAADAQGYKGEKAKRFARQLLRAQRAYGFTRPLSALATEIRLVPTEI